MKKPTFISLVLITFSLCNTFSQTKILDSIYSSYFEKTREIPYLHLNKTTFLEGEEIWYTAYVLEQNSKKPHPTTANLYVSIFDDNGKLKDQQLVHIKDGKGNGSIYLDSSFTKENYYIKASTKWMKNFNESSSFSQKIKLLSNKRKPIISESTEENFFDFQIFPEGGHFVEDLINTVGILIKDKNGNGQKIVKGFLKDFKSDKVIGEFNNNAFGLGKFSFDYKKNKEYIVEVTLENGSVLNKKLPLAKEKGIVLNVKNTNTKFIEISLITNNKTLREIKDKKFNLWIHNTNTYYKNNIIFQNKELAKTLFVKNDILPTGVNIITVFDEENTPLLERIIFNNHKDLFFQPSISSKTIDGDSIRTTITNNSNKTIQLSASFLPRTTKAYNPKNNIISSFLLNPYIKGDVENSDYYFNKITRKKLLDLDLLLLTQGWSKYNWKDVFKNPPAPTFDFETGMDITIKLNTPLRKNQKVLVYSEENNLIREIPPKQNPYIIKNSFVKKNSSIDFALKYKKNLLKITPVLSFSSSKLNEEFSINDFDSDELNELVISNFERLEKGTELLDEVIITSKVKEFDNKIIGIASELRTFDARKLIVPTLDLLEYIRSVRLQYSQSSRPLGPIFLNNEPVWFNSLLEGISWEEVREVAIGVPSFASKRYLYIYTYSFKEFNKMKVKLETIKIPVGFVAEKEYYEPKYPTFLNNTFRNYGVLGWKPNITIQPNSSININIPLHYQKGINTYLEGINENGQLFSKKLMFNK